MFVAKVKCLALFLKRMIIPLHGFIIRCCAVLIVRIPWKVLCVIVVGILKRKQVRNIYIQFKTRNIRLRLENFLVKHFFFLSSVDILSKLLPVLLVYDLHGPFQPIQNQGEVSFLNIYTLGFCIIVIFTPHLFVSEIKLDFVQKYIGWKASFSDSVNT